jgi:hypothetical protein
VANPWNVTDETVEPMPNPAPPSPSDVSFWNSNPYRSGGDDWNRFLEIEPPESEETGSAASATGESAPRDDAPPASPMSELAQLADSHEAESVTDAEPSAVVSGFEFLSETSDDLLPDR